MKLEDKAAIVDKIIEGLLGVLRTSSVVSAFEDGDWGIFQDCLWFSDATSSLSSEEMKELFKPHLPFLLEQALGRCKVTIEWE